MGKGDERMRTGEGEGPQGEGRGKGEGRAGAGEGDPGRKARSSREGGGSNGRSGKGTLRRNSSPHLSSSQLALSCL